MTMGGPAAPDTRCGRSVASTAAAHTPACSTASVLLGTGSRAAMGFLDAMSRSNMEIPQASGLHQDAIRRLLRDGSSVTN